MNLDNRSLHINFEVVAFTPDAGFAARVGEMLARDFAHCRPATAAEYEDRWLGFRLIVKAARLLDPIL